MKRGRKEIVICQNCNQYFEILKVKLNAGKGKYCTKECYNSFRLKNKKDEKYLNKLYQKKNKYNLTEKEYSDLMTVDKCQICNKNFTNNSEKCIDHCHKTLKVRGILCHNCNKAIGLFYDNTVSLKAALNYLEKG